MGKFNKPQQNANKAPYKKQQNNFDRPRNSVMSFSLVLSGKTANDREYTPESVIENMKFLQDNGIYSLLSVPVQTVRTNLDPDDPKKGNITVGFIKEFFADTQTVDVSIYGGSAETISKIASDLVIVPRMIVKNGEVVTFLGFDLTYAK